MQSQQLNNQTNPKPSASQMQPSETQKKPQLQQKAQLTTQNSQNKQLIMKLYVYGSCQSDQFRHPNKLSESKRPICLTNIEKFDLNEDEDDESQNDQQKKGDNIYVNPLYKKSIYKIACGGLHSVVLTTDGKAYTFGCNDEGALGRKGPECIPLEVVLDNPVDLVSAGDNHTMFANSVNGIVYFTGNYNYLRGQKMKQNVTQPIKFTTVSLDIRNKNHPIQKLVSGANHTCILVNNKIFCRGEPQSFTTGRRINQRRKTESSLVFDGVGLNNVQDVWCGGYHTVAKVKKGKDFIYHTWGKNDQGQLGIGNFKSQAYPVEIKSLRGKNILKVAAGGFFTLFLTENGEILGCGSNQYGQLGLGEDYEFIASDNQSEDQEAEQKQEELNKHVENLKIDEQNLNKQSKPMEIESNINVENKAEIKGTNQMVSEKQQVKQAQNPVQNTSIHNNGPFSAVNQNENKGQDKSNKKKFQQKNTYIKSVRPLTFPQQNEPTKQITNIAAGSQFAFAWNNVTELYSWGFGMNYVLLNGQESQQYQPFKVKNKIINDEIIQQIQAGGQHVLYTAFEKTQNKSKPNIVLDTKVTALFGGQKAKLSRKRKN